MIVATSSQLKKLIVVQSSNNTKHREMDALCTLRRYPHLFGRFCHDGVDREVSPNCTLPAFEEHFQRYEKDRLVWGCPYDEAVCYAKRYSDLFNAYCQGGDETKCNYYLLRNHYEKFGIKKRRVWGCGTAPFIIPPTFERRYPLNTINTLPLLNAHGGNVLGNAPVDLFQGIWEPVAFDDENYPAESICPKFKAASYIKSICNLRGRDGYHPARYVAQGLPKTFPARRFAERLKQDGGIALVGDSIMRQMKSEFICQLEYDGAPTQDMYDGVYYYQKFFTFLPDNVYDRFELRNTHNLPEHDKLAYQMKLDWVDNVIEKKPKYLLFLTAAWWNPTVFYHRGSWNDYKNWTVASLEDVLGIYRTTMEQTILPLMKSLVDDHGIIPIWMDMPPAGRINLSVGTHDNTKWKGYYYVFAKYNEVGRDVMARAGGLVLPLWDATMPRWQDHKGTEAGFSGYDDQLHWCEGTSPNDSLPALWWKMLSTILYGDSLMDDNYNTTVNSNYTTETISQSANAVQSKTSQSIFSSGRALDDTTISPISKSHLNPPNCSEAADNQLQCSSNILCMRDENDCCVERFAS